MSEQHTESLYKEQKKIRPKIDDIFGDVLSGEKFNIALDFIAYLKAKKNVTCLGFCKFVEMQL